MGKRRGSALLIVLGFLSFMVVSAVAFSIYMRSERVPSSVFRRNVSVRHLMQAGLAHAMSELDDAIRDDPFPGVVRNPNDIKKHMQRTFNLTYGESTGLVNGYRYIDYWQGRVFMPPNPDDKEDGSLLAPESETVSTVNIEGLGYVPPPLINDVRFLSRRSWTAKWRHFDYGMGRFAYCAVNVSDYFDINRMLIAEPRTGFNRVSLAPLFNSGNDRLDVDQSKIDKFKSFVTSPGGDSDGANGSWQLVSMLDYALAGRNSANGFQSDPFYKWISGSSKTMYPNGADDDARQQVFVTDSWFPPSYNDKAKPDLALDSKNDGQPFDLNQYADMTKEILNVGNLREDFNHVKNAIGDNGLDFNKMMSITELACLYDYLDRDDLPLSLSLPTIERMPMVVAISPQGNCSFKVPGKELKTANKEDPGPHSTVVTLEGIINSFAGGGMNIVLAYPFKHGKFSGVNLDNESYTLRTIAKLFFVSKSTQVRTRGTGLSWSDSADLFRPDSKTIDATSPSMNDGVITFVGTPQPVKASEFGDKLAIDKFVMFKQDSAAPDAIPLVEYISKYEPRMVNGVDEGGTTKNTWKVLFAPWTIENKRHGDYGTEEMDHLPGDSSPNHQFVPVLMVWVRIERQDGYVVDCVPATFYEDTLFNGKQVPSFSPTYVCGSSEPFLRFTCDGDGLEYNKIEASITPGQPLPEYNLGFTWKQKSLWAVDPRYNHAPEDWCMSSQDIRADKWQEDAYRISNDAEEGGTPYFSVSNQGFLQSVGEFAFLPRVKTRFCEDATGGGPIELWGGLWTNQRGTKYISGLDEFNSAPDGSQLEVAWKCYQPWWWSESDKGDNLFGCGITDAPGGGFVNPYSDNVNVFMAALANTPVNWWAAAGTNTVRDASEGQNADDSISKRNSKNCFADLKESLKYAFNEEGSAGSEHRKLEYKALKRLAAGMMNAFRAGVLQNKTWDQIYDSWDWTPDGTPFLWMGTEDGAGDFRDDLDAIDCRYLHSFWRGCFANRQQLFLVFVRAESMALGGSGEGQIPPQMGGRAVALVWRDPETPKNSNDSNIASDRKPHRMRTLFYHQFE